ASISRSGCVYKCRLLPVSRRFSTSTQPTSIMRWPWAGSRPVVSVSRTIWRMCSAAVVQLIDAAIGQRIRGFVAGVAAVALDPVPVDVVARAGRIQTLPQVGVLDRLSGGRFPAIALPAGQPLRHALAQVIGIGMQFHVAGTLERIEGLDGGGQLHPIVGGQRLAAMQLTHVVATTKQCAPTARPGIAATGTIGINNHVRILHWRESNRRAP